MTPKAHGVLVKELFKVTITGVYSSSWCPDSGSSM